MQDFPITGITPGYFFSQPVFLDEGFVLTVPEVPVSAQLLRELGTWGFGAVKSAGTMQATYSVESEASSSAGHNDDAKLTEARAFYDDIHNFARTVFSDAELKGSVSYRLIAAKMPLVIKQVQANKRYILQVEKDYADSRIYQQASHAVRSTILSIIIGIQRKLPIHKMIELAIAAFVHEIGMVRLPVSVTNSTSDLTPAERKQIQTHPLLGFTLLKDNNFPMTVCAAAAEHHERENGSGYPRHLSGANIGEYSKIVSVACSYEAITSKRSYHLARSGFEGIIDILKNKDRGYDDATVKALVMSVSIYPIGSYVLLSNDKKAQVIDTYSANPRYPMVELVDEVSPDGKHPVVETSPVGLSIVRVLNKEQA
jgi:HD-GYP domain-containing protein (c-di-GMP phosphodiesterase class II)